MEVGVVGEMDGGNYGRLHYIYALCGAGGGGADEGGGKRLWERWQQLQKSKVKSQKSKVKSSVQVNRKKRCEGDP